MAKSSAKSIMIQPICVCICICWMMYAAWPATWLWQRTLDHITPFPRVQLHEQAVPSNNPHNKGVVWDVVKDFGAVGDGVHDDSTAIQRMLEAVSEYRREERESFQTLDNHQQPQFKWIYVYFPCGYTFTLTPLNITDDYICMDIAGTIQAVTYSEDFDEKWPRIAPFPSYGNSRDAGHYLQYQPFLYLVNVSHVIIRGNGTVNGNGPWWWKAFQRDDSTDIRLSSGRPNLLGIINSQHITVSHVTFEDSPFWTIHPLYSEHLHFHHLRILSPMYAPNVDGIDPDSCKHVLIEYNFISCGDDHIAIKAGVCGYSSPNDCHNSEWQWWQTGPDGASTTAYTTDNVTVRHNLLQTGMGIALGSELSGGIQNVHIYNNTIGDCIHGTGYTAGNDEVAMGETPGSKKMGSSISTNANNKFCGWSMAIHLKTTLTRSGFLRNILIEKNNIINTTGFFLMETDYHSPDAQPPTDYPTTEIRNITLLQNRGVGLSVDMTWQCAATIVCEDINVFQNVIDLGNPDDYHCSYVDVYYVDDNQPSGLGQCFELSMNRTVVMHKYY